MPELNDAPLPVRRVTGAPAITTALQTYLRDGLSPDMFGTLTANNSGTGTANATAFQAAIDEAIGLNLEEKGVFKVRIPPGRYRTDRPLLIAKHNSGTGLFSAATLTMEADASRGYGSGFRTKILMQHVNGPGIIIQRGRAVILRGFGIQGKASSALPSMSSIVNDDTGTPWWNAGTARDERYTPECGIYIDPFQTGEPPEGGYSGLSSYYTSNAAGSSIILIDDMEIDHHIVGIGISLSGGTQLADNVIVNRPKMYGNKVAIATGQDQTRGVWVKNPMIFYFRKAFDTAGYGDRLGQLPHIHGGLVDIGKWFMEGDGGRGIGDVSGVYSESLFSLGKWGSGFPLNFHNCEFKFVRPEAYSVRGPDYHLQTAGNVHFVGCILTQYNGERRRLVFANRGMVSFANTTFDNFPILETPDYASFSDCYIRYASSGNYFGFRKEYTADLSLIAQFNYEYRALPGGVIHDTAAGVRYRYLDGWETLTVESSVTVTASGLSATFDTTKTWMLQVGDELCTTTSLATEALNPYVASTPVLNGSLGKVASIVGNTVTLESVPRNVTTGTYNVHIRRLPKIRQRSIGTVTNGSADITSITNNGWNVGDRIKGTGIPVGAVVTVRDTTSITISTTATATNTNVELYDARLAIEPNARSTIPTGFGIKGDFYPDSAPTKDASNMIRRGWVCTVTGSSATFEPVYDSAVSPAT